MSDALTLVFEEGYQACLSGWSISVNPYDCVEDYLNWKHWMDGYTTATNDNSTATD